MVTKTNKRLNHYIHLFSIAILAISFSACEPQTSSCHELGDNDLDGVGNACDNCTEVPNTSQADFDSDGIGNHCDSLDHTQNPDTTNPAGNAYQNDSDNDGTKNPADGCPNNSLYTITAECTDRDNDGIANAFDNCPWIHNDQSDSGGTAAGDACEDRDNDSFNDDVDNCPDIASYHGENYISCSDAGDNDGIADVEDNCPNTANGPLIPAPGGDIQEDDGNFNGSPSGTPNDNIGDACIDWDFNTDIDDDGIPDHIDNCVVRSNGDQNQNVCLNPDGDSHYNASRNGPAPLFVSMGDIIDNCPDTANENQLNTDATNDGGDACDNDDDNDGIADTEEWPGCEKDDTFDANGWLTCGTNVNTKIQTAWNEWYAQIRCHQDNDNDCEANPDSTGEAGFTCNRTNAAYTGNLRWNITASDSTQNWNNCRYTTENNELGTSGVAGYDLEINGSLGAAPDGTGGSIYPSGTVTAVVRADGPDSWHATTGDFHSDYL